LNILSLPSDEFCGVTCFLAFIRRFRASNGDLSTFCFKRDFFSKAAIFPSTRPEIRNCRDRQMRCAAQTDMQALAGCSMQPGRRRNPAGPPHQGKYGLNDNIASKKILRPQQQAQKKPLATATIQLK
jgi:hypothetical protein